MKKLILAGATMLFVFLFTGCSGGYVVTERPSVEARIRPASPGIDYVWIDGDWYWSGGRYVYREGYWGRPRGHRTWHNGSWVQRNHGWYWRKGGWH